MNYNEIKTLLTSLGWESKDWFNGRELYCLKDAPYYQVFEHMNEIGVVNPYDEELGLIYCDMTADELKEYTRLCKELWRCKQDPKAVSYYAYREALRKHKDFIKQMDEKED